MVRSILNGCESHNDMCFRCGVPQVKQHTSIVLLVSSVIFMLRFGATRSGFAQSTCVRI